MPRIFNPTSGSMSGQMPVATPSPTSGQRGMTLDEFRQKNQPQTPPDSQSASSSIGSDLFKTFTEPFQKLGSGLGRAAYELSGGSKQAEEQSAISASNVQKLLDLSRDARNKGDTSRADYLLNKAKSFSQSGSEEASKRLSELEQAKTETLQGGLGTSATFIPGGKGLAGMAASGALTGGLLGASQGKDVSLGNVASGALTGGVFGAALGATGKALKKVGEKLSSGEKAVAAKNVIEKALSQPKTLNDEEKMIGLLSERLGTEPALRTKSTAGGKFLRGIFEGLDKTDVRHIGGLNNASEELSTMVKPGSSYQDILKTSSKITGFDADGNPGLLQAIKEEALGKAGAINIEDIGGTIGRLDKNPMYSNVNQNVKDLANQIITQSDAVPSPEGQKALASSIFSKLRDLEAEARAIRSASSRTPADEKTLQYIAQVKLEIMDKLDEQAVKNGALDILRNPQLKAEMEKNLGKSVADRISSIKSLSELRKFEQPWVAASKGISALLERGPKGQFAARAGGGAIGAATGASEGYKQGGIPGAVTGLVGGALAGTLAPTALESVRQTIEPKILTTFARGASSLPQTSGITSKVGQAISGLGSTLMSPSIQKAVETGAVQSGNQSP